MQPNQQPINPAPAAMPAPAPVASGGKPTPASPKNPNSTQNTLVFEELRDKMVIMGDGTFRAVVAAQSINFDLMSGRERDSIEMSYQDFLNSLTFPIQIYIRSQRVDIGPYLDKLEQLRVSQDNMLLGVLMDDYIQFIDALSQEANIMDKSFFIVVPYSIGEGSQRVGDSTSGKFPLTQLFAPTKNHQHIKVPADQYERAKDEIQRRVNAVIDGLAQVGIRAVRLDTRELGELYYNIYNPDTALRQPIGDFKQFTGTVVQKGQGPAPSQPVGGV
ncbi:hypothetical protein FWG95_00520 [Candidatus Saccharibacteria bacterium]|nr:hypothetical protein [Candidatus Saccharibacteria bacterium]